jgi:hypothetical protein
VAGSSATRTRVHEIQVGMAGGVFGAGGASGDEADGADDEENAGPAVEGEVLVKPEAAEEGDDDVAKGGGGHDEGEIGPGERGHVTGEEADEQDDTGDDVGVEEGVEEQTEVVEVDGADLSHAAREQGVSDGGGEHDREEDEVTLRGESVLHLNGELCLLCVLAKGVKEGFPIEWAGYHTGTRIECRSEFSELNINGSGGCSLTAPWVNAGDRSILNAPECPETALQKSVGFEVPIDQQVTCNGPDG